MTRDIWDARLRRTVLALEWLALAVGILVSVERMQNDPLAFVAAGLGAAWVVTTTSIPLDVLRRPFVLDGVTLMGVALVMTSLVLTGGVESPYLLLALTPAIFAAMFGGIRLALSAGALTALLSTAVPLASGRSVVESFPLSTLALALSVAVSRIQKIFLELDARAAVAEASSDASTIRLEHLESANQLLGKLAEITERDEINPVAVGRAALETIVGRFPDSAGTAALESETGPIMVARYGTVPEAAFETDIPLLISNRRVGFIRLSTPQPLDDGTIAGLNEAVRPVSLAFANALLLQDVSQNAVREERIRLARELHDEIGPSLASLGLGLDMALIRGVDQSQVNDHLETLRARVTDLVDEVRYTVTDLRSATGASLVTRIEELKKDLVEPPSIAVDIDERRPVRPSLAENVHGIIGEALRNAVRHSNAEKVSVRGWVDFDRGRVVVIDDGTGFDPTVQRDGHYGVIGMHERAEDSNLRLNVSSSSAGTRVQVEWGQS